VTGKHHIMCVIPLFIPAHSTHSFNRPYTYIRSTITHSLHRLEEVEKEITWAEVGKSCCCHDAAGWFKILLNFVGIAFCLYWFIFSLELLSTGAKVLTGCAAGSLFGGKYQPRRVAHCGYPRNCHASIVEYDYIDYRIFGRCWCYSD
jgi:hypothetical protein